MLHSPPNLVGSPSPVVGLADEYPAGFVDSLHSHNMIQLLYASSGVMSVVTNEESFIIPPQRAVWIPEGVVHEVSCRGAVSIRTLYIDAAYQRHDRECHIVEVSPFLQALIVEVTQFFSEASPSEREKMIVDLLLKEITSAPKFPTPPLCQQTPDSCGFAALSSKTPPAGSSLKLPV